MATDVVKHEMKEELKEDAKQEEGFASSAPAMSTSPCPNQSPLPTPKSATPSKMSKSPVNGFKTQGSGKRPTRKSTLTQQQKNQKRQRATQDQLATLEMEFNKNPTPTATVRDRIAEEINMTERSVQIWFQNR
jgi:hypothetical protein